MNIISIAVSGVIICLLAVTLKQHRPDFAAIVGIVGGIILIAAVIFKLTDIFGRLDLMAQKIEMNEEVKTLIKVLGICLVAQSASDICRDSGYSSIASKVEFSGKILVLFVSFPMFEKLMELAAEMVTG